MKQKVLEGFVKPFMDVYQQEMSSTLHSLMNKLKAPAKQRKILSIIDQNQKIKTIWHTDRPLKLSTIYYPTAVVSANRPAQKIKSLSELGASNSIFFGTAGQGKSVFLKHLIEGEILYSKNIPVYVELRNYKNGDFEEFLLSSLSSLLDEEFTSEAFELFCRRGKISFLLDGFDEVDEAHQENCLAGINLLSKKYDQCKIALTSRPDYPCEFLQNFNNYNIKPLEMEDLAPFYKKVTRDETFSKKLVQAINTSPTKIKELIKTPLLATLLAISYKSAQKIPLEFSEFYDQLFQILLIRHDGSKLGWHRERRSNLTDQDMQRVFESLCFNCRKLKEITFNREDFLRIAKKSIDKSLVTCKEGDYVFDISKITCLVVSESQGYSFIHSSVPEFFSSKYIRSLGEEKSIEYYRKLLDGAWKRWRPEIVFLEQIDSYRFIKHFETPDILNVTEVFKTNNEISPFKIHEFLKTIVINKKLEKDPASGLVYTRYHYVPPSQYSGYSAGNLVQRVVLLCTSGSAEGWTKIFEGDRGGLIRQTCWI